MPRVRSNGIDIYYEETGSPTDPAMLLIMGLGTQMIAWPDEFVRGLATSGFRVIRFDNRDMGLSQHLDDAPAPNPLLAFIAHAIHLPVGSPYTLTDMATDAVGLLDALEIASAHVVGASMGGAIGQILAAQWSDRVLSLTSIMATSGARGLPGPSADLRRTIMRSRPGNVRRDEAVALGAEVLRLISFPDSARPPTAFRAAVEASLDRASNPAGFRRQLLAIIADGSRADRLARITAPTLVLHGAADPLVPLACGQDVAKRVAGAKIEVIERMAHDLPPSQIPVLVDSIVRHARSAAAGPE